jgi:hypothetical protein
MEHFDVVLTGKLLAGTDLATAIDRLAAMTNLQPAKVEQLLSSGQSTVVKREVSAEVAEQYRAALTGIGVEVELQPVSIAAVTDAAAPLADSADGDTAAKPSPVAAIPVPEPQPSSPPAVAWPTGHHDHRAQGAPRGVTVNSVPAAHGWTWVKDAVDLYMDQRWFWTGMVLLFGLLMVVVSLIPVLGSLAATLAGPVLSGGMMRAARSQQQGKPLQVSLLFCGWSDHRKELLLLGVFNLLYALLLGLLVFVFTLLFFQGLQSPPTAAVLMQHGAAAAGLMLLVVLLSMLVGMAMWFAPCLVVLEGQAAGASMKNSCQAVAQNWRPFLAYGLVLLLAALVVSVLIGLVVGVLGTLLSFGGVQWLTPLLMLALASPTIAVFTLTSYTGYRDIFS